MYTVCFTLYPSVGSPEFFGGGTRATSPRAVSCPPEPDEGIFLSRASALMSPSQKTSGCRCNSHFLPSVKLRQLHLGWIGSQESRLDDQEQEHAKINSRHHPKWWKARIAQAERVCPSEQQVASNLSNTLTRGEAVTVPKPGSGLARDAQTFFSGKKSLFSMNTKRG